MYLFIFFILMYFVILSIFMIIHFENRSDETLVNFSFFYFVFSFFIWLTVCSIFQSFLPSSLKKVKQVDIYSLRDNLTIESNFALGCGYLNSDLYYFYYVYGEFGYKIEKINSKDVEIVEFENEFDKPCIVYYQKKLDVPNYWFSFGDCMFDTIKTCVIYVPKGTLTFIYDVDLS